MKESKRQRGGEEEHYLVFSWYLIPQRYMWLTMTCARHAPAVLVLSLYPERERKWLLTALVIQYLMLTFLTKIPIRSLTPLSKRFLLYMFTFLIESDPTPNINSSQKCITLYKNITKTRKLFCLRDKIMSLNLEINAGGRELFYR